MYIYWYKCIYIGINVMKQNLFDGLSMHWRERDAPLWKIGGGERFFLSIFAQFLNHPPPFYPWFVRFTTVPLKAFVNVGFL